MDGLQAAILNVKMTRLKDWTERRREIARRYDEVLADHPSIKAPVRPCDREHVYHLYVVRTRNRDQLQKYLSVKGIETLINYPVALPFVPAFQRFLHQREDFPSAYSAQLEILSIPLYPELQEVEVGCICDVLSKFEK